MSRKSGSVGTRGGQPPWVTRPNSPLPLGTWILALEFPHSLQSVSDRLADLLDDLLIGAIEQHGEIPPTGGNDFLCE